MRRFEPEGVGVSAYGMREGMLYRQMPEAMRLQDPLLEACRHMEAARRAAGLRRGALPVAAAAFAERPEPSGG